MKYSCLFVILLTVSCNNNSSKPEQDFIYMNLNNKSLETAIIEYHKKLVNDNSRSVNRGDSVYVGVYMKDICDSIKRFVLCPILDYYSLDFITPFFICRVNGHDVFFFAEAGMPYYYGNERYFKISQEKRLELIKTYFPNRYREYEKKGYFSNSRTDHSEYCRLTFYNDSLIDKTYQRGMWRDRVLVRIGDEEFLY